MTSTYYRAQNSISLKQRNSLKQWEQRAKEDATKDELMLPIGIQVCRNLRCDEGFQPPNFINFIRHLVGDDGSIRTWPDAQTATLLFIKSCYANQRCGRRAHVGLSELWHVIPEAQLRSSINICLNYPGDPNDNSNEWKLFQDACFNSNWTTVGHLLAGAAMHPRGFQAFATFCPVTGTIADWMKPEHWDATTACAALGLSKDWNGYRTGDTIWIVRYSLNGAEAFIPTCADADWRAIFRPSRSSKARYGITIPLGPIRIRLGATPALRNDGMPEVVHSNIPMYYISSVPPSIHPGHAVVDIIRSLGKHSGW